jgi:hypothetical protein
MRGEGEKEWSAETIQRQPAFSSLRRGHHACKLKTSRFVNNGNGLSAGNMAADPAAPRGPIACA